MKINIRADVVKNKSFDPYFVVKVSYDDGTNRFVEEMVSVERKPPRVTIEYPETVNKMIDRIDIKKIELEIMKAIVEDLLGPAKR